MTQLELGQKITQLRKARGYSQEYVASATNISRATLSRMEQGVEDVSIKNLLKVIHYLGYELVIQHRSKFPTFEELQREA